MDQWLNILGQELRYLLPPRSVREHARATDLVERNRFIDAFPFFWSFVVGTTQSNGSLAAAQDLYKAFTSDFVAYSSVQQWVTAELTELLTNICGYISVELGQTESALEGRFECFRDVFISDGIICTLSAESFDEFPGLGDDHAGAKLHVIKSLASRAPIFSSITDARTQETTQLQVGDWIDDSLLLFDLGYLDYACGVGLPRDHCVTQNQVCSRGQLHIDCGEERRKLADVRLEDRDYDPNRPAHLLCSPGFGPLDTDIVEPMTLVVRSATES